MQRSHLIYGFTEYGLRVWRGPDPLVKLLPAVAGGELLKIDATLQDDLEDGGGAVGDVGNAGACVSKR